MMTAFGASSTTDDVLAGANLHGKRILVTGVSAGLGVESARALAARDAQVVGAAWDLVKANAATEQVRKYVTLIVGSEGVRGYALDPTNAEALWKKSEELVGESF